MKRNDVENAVEILNKGGIGVMPTDTIYGLVASAFDSRAVERVYDVRNRKREKPCLILIEKIDDISLFDIFLTDREFKCLEQTWSLTRATSVIFSCVNEKYKYLHREKRSLGFRIPITNKCSCKNDIMGILQQTGPLIAPSANIAGEIPARTVVEAKKYFEDNVDFYLQCDHNDTQPSMIIKCEDGIKKVLRS